MPSPLIEAILGTGDSGITGDEFITHGPRVIDHGNGVVQRFEDGVELWYKDGLLHRDGDLPAVIRDDGTKMEWYKDGQLHRDGDKPAVVRADGSQDWYKNGKRHRDDDKPAVIRADGAQEWYQHGLRRRDGDKPTVVYPDGTMIWYKNGKPYRIAKPLKIRPDGSVDA